MEFATKYLRVQPAAKSSTQTRCRTELVKCTTERSQCSALLRWRRETLHLLRQNLDQRATRGLGGVSLADISRVRKRSHPQGRGDSGDSEPESRLTSGPQLRVSAQRPRTTSCHLTSSRHLLKHSLTASPQQRLSSPHLLDFVNHPISPQRPGELVSPTRGEGSSSSCLSVSLQKLR